VFPSATSTTRVTRQTQNGPHYYNCTTLPSS